MSTSKDLKTRSTRADFLVLWRGQWDTDGPFGEAKEVIGGYWIIVAGKSELPKAGGDGSA